VWPLRHNRRKTVRHFRGPAPPQRGGAGPRGRALRIEQAETPGKLRAKASARRGAGCGPAVSKPYGQAGGSISTGKLNALPRLHTQPIDVVVYYGSHREN
jgi:hypothetical protein